MRLKDKTAIVTGGGRGLGRAAALTLAQEGANVTVAARTVTEIEEVAEEIRALGKRALSIQTDVSDAAAVKTMVDVTVDQFGTVDSLVNCAGVIGQLLCKIGSPLETALGAYVLQQPNRFVRSPRRPVRLGAP